jgi:hypothetical protein
MRLIILVLASLVPITAQAQIGIGTSSPTTTLDVNGNFRIRSTTGNTRESAAKDSILVVDCNGNVQRTTSKLVVSSYLKTSIRGSFSGSDQTLTMSSGTAKMPFDYEDFDENSEFSTSTNTFTAKTSGIFSVAVQVKAVSTISVTPSFGVSISKNSTVIARAGFANVGVTILFVNTNITPPIRFVQTLVKLDVGDTIKFNAYSDLGSVGLLGTKEDSFFMIQQVR